MDATKSEPLGPASTGDAPKRRFTLLDQICISCLWLAYNVQWGALLAIVLPSQISAIVGAERKEFFNGLIGPIGAVAALIVPPLAGALSDRSRSRFGRRRPYLLVGVIINVFFLLFMSRFSDGSNIWLFALCYTGIQIGCNWMGGPYAGLIPDIVPKDLVGRASGFQALMTALGTIIGALAAGQLIQGNDYSRVYGLIVISMIAMLLLTLWGVREKPLTTPAPPFELKKFLLSFYLDPKKHRDFYWVLFTRMLVTMGVYSVFTFFQYFLKDVIQVPDPERQSSYLVGIIIAAGVPTSILAGSLSDRYGRKLLVYISGGIMAVAATIFIAVAIFPSLAFTFAVAALFGIGNGAYQAVDWAMAVDVLPSEGDAAKDMGIWHAALVVPQIFAPVITGLTLNSLKETSLLAGYTAVFVMTAVWFVLGTIFVRQIRGVR